jgi:hypothetical protein
MTLARRHFQRVSAAQPSASATPGETVNANAYELVLAKLGEDKRRLKQVQSIERKIEIKRGLLPSYQPGVDGVLEGGHGGQDAVLMTVMVWKIDTGDFPGALQIARHALDNNLVMPDQYQRGVPTLVAEEIAEQALAAFSSGGGFSAEVLATTVVLTDGHDMPDEVRAKLNKASGLALAATMEDSATPALVATEALACLRRALQLHDRAGVKKDIERLERFIKNNPEEASVTAVDRGASGDAVMDPPGAPDPALTKG